MTFVTLKLTCAELELLTALASDQLFRREFIDPKLPGHRPDAEQVAQGKALVARMRSILDPGAAKRMPPVRVPR